MLRAITRKSVVDSFSKESLVLLAGKLRPGTIGRGNGVVMEVEGRSPEILFVLV